MWFLLLYMQISAVQGFNVSLRGSESRCSGRLEVYNGHQWGLVCHYGWIKENGEVVCKSIGCGAHVQSGMDITLYKHLPPPNRYLMDRVKCTSEENNLWSCPFVSEENVKCKEGSFIIVECSGEVLLSLNLNGQTGKCAGVVEFSTPNGVIGVCNSNWDAEKADKICQELDCGKHYYIPKPGMFKGRQSEQNGIIECVGNEQYSWQCMELSKSCPDQASVICAKHKRFRLQNGSNLCSGSVEEFDARSGLWSRPQMNDTSAEVICQQMHCGSTKNFTNNTLQCTENVKLRNFTSKCFGDVLFLVNGSDLGVCYSGLDLTQRHNVGTLVCRELGCGEMLDVQESGISYDSLSNIECNGSEESLWHCQANHQRKECKTIKVICSDSLDVRLTDGLGRCSGRVEVKLEDRWWSIRSFDWTTENSDVVCKHLGCGASAQMPKDLFADGKVSSLDFWNIKCQNSLAKLHKCFRKIPYSPPFQNIIKIICQEEQIVFFEGDSPCKGRVRITSIDGAEPVGEKKKNASDICSAMQCGNLVSFESNTTSATCSGSVNVALRNTLAERCWGTLEVCRGSKCEGVCRNTWTKQDSAMICGNLGCGDAIQTQFTPMTNNSTVSYYSVFCSKELKNMSMCNFIPNKDSICQDPAQVVCAGSIKVKLEDARDKCAGKVLVFFAGKWTPVCSDHLDERLQNAVCKELNCGESDYSTSHDDAIITGLSGINCLQAENFSQCDFKRMSSEQRCIAGYLTCKGWKRLFLYKKKDPCKGPVYMYSQNEALLVRSQRWSKEEGQNMCEYLQCGNYTSHSENNISKNSIMSWNQTYTCSMKKKMWECVRQDQPVELQTQLNIECDGKPSVTLSSNCTGEVLINNENVCVSHWTDQMSDELCDSLKCGSAIHHWETRVPVKQHWHFSCTSKETLLRQCSSKKVQCGSILSVACEKSLQFASTEKCGGILGVNYRDQWEYVCGKLNISENEKVCHVLKCKDTTNTLLDPQKIAKEIKVTFKCPRKFYNTSQCIHIKNNACRERPAEVICDGYVKETGDSSVNLIVGLILGMLGLLVLVVVGINRKRLLLALRNYRYKYGRDIHTDGNEMDNIKAEDRENTSFFDHDDYEDVDSVMNKSGEEDEDDRSKGSSGTEYDDVEGQASGGSTPQTFVDVDLNLPVLPKRPEEIPADQDTYEVETEKLDDYDDVAPVEAAANENSETTDTGAKVVVDEKADADSGAGSGANVDALTVTTEVQVHDQPKQ